MGRFLFTKVPAHGRSRTHTDTQARSACTLWSTPSRSLTICALKSNIILSQPLGYYLFSFFFSKLMQNVNREKLVNGRLFFVFFSSVKYIKVLPLSHDYHFPSIHSCCREKYISDYRVVTVQRHGLLLTESLPQELVILMVQIFQKQMSNIFRKQILALLASITTSGDCLINLNYSAFTELKKKRKKENAHLQTHS